MYLLIYAYCLQQKQPVMQLEIQASRALSQASLVLLSIPGEQCMEEQQLPTLINQMSKKGEIQS